MNIGKLAISSGLSQSRIRFYERVGLLTNVLRRPNGYRDYPPEAAVVLDLIATAQEAGFSLDEIRSLLPDLNQGTPDSLLGALRLRVEKIEALQARLGRSKEALIAKIAAIERMPRDVEFAPKQRPTSSRKQSNKSATQTEIVLEEKMFGEIAVSEVSKKDGRRR